MSDVIYKFRGKDVTEKVLAKVEDVIAIIEHQLNAPHDEARQLFYDSEIYKNVLESETGLWAQTAEYIADHYFEEIGIKNR